MSDLAAFLLARIAEDEAIARQNTGDRGLGDDGSFPDYRTYDGDDINAADAFLGHFTPPRVLAECDAKRRIVERYADHLSTVRAYRSPRWADAMNAQDKQDARLAEARHSVAEDAARLLALPYADHNDYLEEWKP